MQNQLIIPFLILLIAGSAFGQKTFVIDDFSKEYFAKVTILPPEIDTGLGCSVEIIDRKNGKTVITSEGTPSILYEKYQGDTIRNIPYSKQGIVKYEDYNFDGVKDIGIFQGIHGGGCSVGEGYNVFLNKNGCWLFSPKLSEIVYLELNPKAKIFTQSTCGSAFNCRAMEIYTVKYDKPVLLQTESDLYLGEDTMYIRSIHFWNEGKCVRTTQRMYNFNPHAEEVMCTFVSDHNKKRIVLLYDNSTIQYMLLDSVGQVEYSYPKKIYAPSLAYSTTSKPFIFDTSGTIDTLTFENRTARYSIYCDSTGSGAGIQIVTKGKTFHWKASLKTIVGSLSGISESFENLKMK